LPRVKEHIIVVREHIIVQYREHILLFLSEQTCFSRVKLITSTVSKETYYSVKRDLLQCQKRPTTVSKETYYSVKRDLLQRDILQCQKRPTTVSKETYYSVKRDLLAEGEAHHVVLLLVKKRWLAVELEGAVDTLATPSNTLATH